MRFIDLMCNWHRSHILETRLWPEGYIAGNHDPDGNNSCTNCGLVGRTQPSGRPTLNPAVDPVEEAAVHEVGHAVAYIVHDIKVDYAALEPGWAEGSNAHISLRTLEPHERRTVGLVGLWAGQAAARRWLLETGMLDDAALVDLVVNSHLDAKKIFEIRGSWESIRVARDRADELVDEHWSAIWRVSRVLLERGRLTGDEIADLAELPRAALMAARS